MSKVTIKSNSTQQGFTLIEILVVLAIIGLLASIALTSFSLVRSKGRDAKRFSDIRQINSAIQFYINDNGYAPGVGSLGCDMSSLDPDCVSIEDSNNTEWEQLALDLSPYIPTLPKDPLTSTTGQYRYTYVPPTFEHFSCPPSCISGASPSPANYAIFAQRIENTSQLLNFFYSTVPTFGFGSHNTYSFGD